MTEFLGNLGYVLGTHNNVWSKPNYGGIHYSDGDETEARIGNIIEQASDITVLSSELRQYCTDWPSVYHLSGSRANILRPLEDSLKGDVLEIGAGCGAITRFLGECGANVMALEGSPRRAAIARSRTRDLRNVTVVAESFEEFHCNRLFDVVTLIGVLEYANLFTSGENPAKSMLERAQLLLKPEGKLIIAIENQLGLKYFAGAPEDHLGQAMYGIEGRYRDDQPQTFGRKVLMGMLREAGFIGAEFLAAFPDYKLPVSIITEEGLNTQEFDASAFAWQSARRDPQLPLYCGFSLELAWPEMFKNGLAMDVANSFLIIATPNSDKSIEKGMLAYHYSTDRVSQYCKETRFQLTASGVPEVLYRCLGACGEGETTFQDSVIRQICPPSAPYCTGMPLLWEFVQIVTRDGWTIEEVGQYLKRYSEVVATLATRAAGQKISLSTTNERLPGVCFDFVPQNIIVRSDGTAEVIDQEWCLKADITVGRLLFRGMLLMLASITRFGINASGHRFSRIEFVTSSLRMAGFSITEQDCLQFLKDEAVVQEQVTGLPASNFLSWWPDLPLPVHNLSQTVADRDGQIVQLGQAVAKRDGQIAQLNQSLSLSEEEVCRLNQLLVERERQFTNLSRTVSELGGHVASLGAQLGEREKRVSRLSHELMSAQKNLADIRISTSWRITYPIRALRRAMGDFPWSLIRPIYHRLPFHVEQKEAWKDVFYSKFPRVFSKLPSYHFWQEERQRIEVIAKMATSENPFVSVIIPVYGKVDFTLKCLSSIARHPPKISFEILVIDDCSPDSTRQVLKDFHNIRMLSNLTNFGFIRSCNKGAAEARGEYLCFLNNDTEVSAAWLDELVRTFDEFPGTGLVGSKLVYPNGKLQEAGGILWKDGSAWNFGRGQDASLPVYNYAREVDYCSGASIMVRKSLFGEIGGFDEHYAPAYCEDSDLALRIRERGYRVIYQPLSVVVHHEGVTSGTDTTQGIKAYQIENSKKLYARWRQRLESHQAPGVDVDTAKDRRVKHRVLVLDHCTPTPNQDAGSVTVFNLLLLLREMDFQVTFIPECNFLYMEDYTPALQRAGIEVLYEPYCISVEQHLQQFGSRYDLAFLFRPGVMDRHLGAIKRFSPYAKVLYHTVDLHFLRMSREADLLGDAAKQMNADSMKRRELAAIRAADASIVHSTSELELLRSDLPDVKIHVFPLIMDVRSTKKGFSDRKDIVFIGGYQHTPNVDAVQFFAMEIMPILRSKLPGIRFNVVGSKPPPEVKALAREDVVITGFVEDLAPVLDQMRVSVAPLRYGAGIKGKIGTAMAAGLPTVATSLAAEGMSLTDGMNILIADSPDAFADVVARLYSDETLWNTLSKTGLQFAEKVWGAEAAYQTLEKILNDIDLFPSRRQYQLKLYAD